MRVWVGCFFALLLTGCGGTGDAIKNLSTTADHDQAVQATLAQLTDRLQAEFDRLGIDPAKVPAAAPSGAGAQVFDLAAALVDPDGAGPEPPTGIELSWTEQMVGDYDQNGEVNFADITPLGLHFNAQVDYGPPDPPGEPAWWPTGDPDGEGALNWRVARIDGDHNGELNSGDVTPIAVHWNERLSGYNIYHRAGTAGDFELMPGEPGAGCTVARADVLDGGAPQAGHPVRCRYFIAITEPGEHGFTLANYDETSSEEGGQMQPCSLFVNAPPLAVLSADPTSGTAPLTVAFDASASTDDGGIDHYEWDYNGDGEYTATTTEPFSEFVYWADGDFEATVKVVDTEGLWSTASVTISVAGLEPGLYIMPDPDDADWEDVTGTGVDGDPYVFPAETSQDLEIEYSLVAYSVHSDSGELLDPAVLTWSINPPFLVQWTAPGTFRVTIFTSYYVFATDAELRESNHLYVLVHTLPE